MLAALGPLLAAEQPAMVLVYGDTNSTLAGALAAAQAGIPVAHVEAGMRSYDRTMPEELNRVLTDHASDLLLCSSEAPAEILRGEGVGGRDRGRRRRHGRRRAAARPARRGAHGGAGAVRPGPRRLSSSPPRTARATSTTRRGWPRSSALLAAVPGPVVLPLHPRTAARLDAAGLRLDGVILAPPLGYLDFTALLRNARAVLTDSGGVQKEAYLGGIPCVTLRETTEWTETVEAGWNMLVDLDAAAAVAALERTPPAERPPLYGDGRAGSRVAAALARRMGL